jgi:uncharacterized protein YmfQ (DUF2313 family)
MALESGHVVKPSNGWYSRVDEDGVVEDKKWRIKDTDSKEFWAQLITSKGFQEAIKNKYQVAHGSIIATEDGIEEELNSILEE